MADLFNIGLSGLKASQTQLSVTGQNISNINTPGYSRQTALQEARQPSFSGSGYIGNGTSIVDVQRIHNQFLTNQVRASTAMNAEATAFQSQLEELNTLISGTATGITPGLQNYFNALQTAIEDPSSLPARQLFLSEAQGLSSRFNTVQERLTVQNQFIGEQIGTLTGQVNRLATSIAAYNDSIAKAAANGKQPNDLLDARDEAIRQLSEHIGITVVPQDNNGINVFVGSGQPLVVGNQASELRAVAGRADPSRTDVMIVSGGSAQDITNLVSGGELGGLLRYRNEVLDPAINSVGRLALSIANEFNSQLAQGLDMNGRVGTNLFVDINSPDQVALRSRGAPNNGDPNAALGVRISDTAQLSISDYEVVFSSSTEFSVRQLSDNKMLGSYTLDSVNPPEVEGFTIELDKGAVGAGDRFLLTPTRFGAGDMKVAMKSPQDLAFASPVAGQASLDNRGTGKITQPELTSTRALDIAQLKGMSPMEFTFTEPGTLAVTSSAGTVSPASFTIEAGKTSVIEWSVTPADGSEPYSFSMSLSGTPKTGDTFSIGFNTGLSDNRNAMKLSALQTAPVLGKTTAGSKGFSFVDGYGDLVQRVATNTAQARSESESSGAVLKQATSNRDSVSAVNLDEEATNLIMFEQYYNASAQVIQIARSVFDTLISSIR